MAGQFAGGSCLGVGIVWLPLECGPLDVQGHGTPTDLVVLLVFCNYTCPQTPASQFSSVLVRCSHSLNCFFAHT